MGSNAPHRESKGGNMTQKCVSKSKFLNSTPASVQFMYQLTSWLCLMSDPSPIEVKKNYKICEQIIHLSGIQTNVSVP